MREGGPRQHALPQYFPLSIGFVHKHINMEDESGGLPLQAQGAVHTSKLLMKKSVASPRRFQSEGVEAVFGSDYRSGMRSWRGT